MAKNKSNDRLPLMNMETKSGRIINALFYPVCFVILYIVFNFILYLKNGGDSWNIILNWKAIGNLFIQYVPNMFIAWGLTFIFSAGPDFSCAANLANSAVLAAVVAVWLNGKGTSSFVCYLGFFGSAIIFFVICQLFATFVRRKFKLSAWVCGFAMMIFYEGLGSFYSESRARMNRPVESLTKTLCRDLPHQPWPVILAIIGLIASYFILNKTKLGIEFRAVGSNPQVATYMGINAKKVDYLATIVGSLFLAVSACYSISYSAKINLSTGMGSMGMLGKGLSTWLISSALTRKLQLPFAILLAGLFLATFFNFLTRMGVPAGTWQEFIMGVFIVVFGALAFAGNKEVVK